MFPGTYFLCSSIPNQMLLISQRNQFTVHDNIQFITTFNMVISGNECSQNTMHGVHCTNQNCALSTVHTTPLHCTRQLSRQSVTVSSCPPLLRHPYIVYCFFHNPIMPPDDDVEEIHLKSFFPRPTRQSFPCILCQWPSLSYHRRRSKSKCASGAPRFLRQSVAPGRPLPAGVSSIC